MHFVYHLNDILGRKLAWLALVLVLLMSSSVLLRYAFDISFIWHGELIQYLHAALFLLTAGYTLYHNRHVRVDVFYERFSSQTRRRINKVGTVLFLIPVCLALIYFSFSFVSESWRIFEASREYNGMQGLFLIKTCLWLYSALLLWQAFLYLFSKKKSDIVANL